MARRYAVQISSQAERQLAGLPSEFRRRVDAKILALAENPRPPGVTKLGGPDEQYRIRIGDYRVIYELHDDMLLVIVLKVAHRSKVYRRMPRKSRG